MNELFRKFSHKTSDAVGSPWAFILALVVIIGWAVTGPLFGFSDTWQLVINTGTTIVTFLMVFLIQNTQNRDAKAIHLKLDELIKGVEGARTGMVDLEEMTDEELKELQEEFKRIHERRKDEVGQAAEKADLVGDEVAHVGGRMEQVEREVRQVDEKVEARTGR